MKTFVCRSLSGMGLLAFLVLFIAIPLSGAYASYPAPVIKVARVCSFHKPDASIGTMFSARITGPSPQDVIVADSGGHSPPVNYDNKSSKRTFTINPDGVEYPTVVSVTPADKAVRAPIDTSIVIQFSKQMDRQSVEYNVEIEDQYENRIQGAFSWGSTVYLDDTVTFTPAQNLDYSQSYEIDIEGGCEDAVNHYPLNGYCEDVETYFATVGAPGDDSAPEVMTVLPYDGQIGGDTSEIGATFSKPLDPATVTDNNVILTGPGVSGYSLEIDMEPYVILIVPDAPLPSGSDFTVSLTTGLTDTEGHSLASTYQWSFNTGDGDTVAPQITQTMPADGATNTGPWSAIKVYFSESMDPHTIDYSTVTVYDETAAEAKIIHLQKEVDNGKESKIVIRPVFEDGQGHWTVAHTYRVTISQDVADRAGNHLASDYAFSFTVVDYPFFAPDVSDHECLGIREPDGSTKVDLSLGAWGANGCENITVVATDLTQAGKIWTLIWKPDSWDFEYESTEDEGLDVGYHVIRFDVTDTVNGHVTNLMWNFYVFNAAPSLTSPVDESQDVSITPPLSWNTNTIAHDDLYAVAIFDSPETAHVVWMTYIIADGSPDYTVTVPACRALTSSTTYYWAVMACDNRYCTQGEARSQLRSFTTIDLCEGDFDNDGDVDGSDLAIFAADFGRTDCAVGPPCEGDFDGDGDVDGSDLAVFAADFGRTDCPH